MNTKVEAQNKDNFLDAAKWALASVLLCLGVYGYHYYANCPAVYRALLLMPVVAVVFFVLISTSRGSDFWRLMREAALEAKRVVWPTRQETTQTTLIVLVVVFVAGFLLWLLDVLLNWLTSMLMG